MTEIERKALALVNGVMRERGHGQWVTLSREREALSEALCRAIEQHEAFRQEVSDMLQVMGFKPGDGRIVGKYIIAELDPLVEAINSAPYLASAKETAEHIRAALAARGGRIVWGIEQ